MDTKNLPSITQIIDNRIEPTEIQNQILTWMKINDGKLFTQKSIAKLRIETGDESIDKRISAGMTSIEWGNYSRSRGECGGSLLIAYAVTSVRIDAKFVEERNQGYFAAAVERNKLRMGILDNVRVHGAAMNVYQLELRIKNFVAARDELEVAWREAGFDDHRLSGDRRAIEDAFGIKEDK